MYLKKCLFFCSPKQLAVLFLYFITLVSSVNVSAQTEMMLLPTNHRQKIVKKVLSPDGKYVLSADWNNVILWEVSSGNSISKYRYTKTNSSDFAFSQAGDRFLICNTSSVNIYQSKTGRLLRSFKVTGIVTAYFIKNSDKILAVSTDKIQTIEISTGRIQKSVGKTYDPLLKFERITLSDNQQNLFIQRKTELIKINVESGNETAYINDDLQNGEEITCFSEDLEFELVAVAYTFGETLIFDAITGSKEMQLGLPFNARVSLEELNQKDTILIDLEDSSPHYGAENLAIINKQELMVHKGDKLEIWNFESGEIIHDTDLPEYFSKDYFRINDSLFLFLNSNSVITFNVHQKKIISNRKLPEKIGLDNIVNEYGRNFSYNTSLQLLLVKDTLELFPMVYDLQRNSIKRRFTKKGIPDIRQAVLMESGDQVVLFAGYENYCRGWDLKKAEPVFSDEHLITDGNYASNTSLGTQIKLSSSKKWFTVSYNDFFNLFNFNTSNNCKIFSTVDYKSKFELKNIDQFDISDNNLFFYQQYVKGGVVIGLLDLISGKTKAITTDTIKSNLLKISPSGNYLAFMKANYLYIYDRQTDKLVKGDRFDNWRDELKSIEFSKNEMLLMVLGEEAIEIPVFSTITAKKIISLAPAQVDKGKMLEWATFHPDNKNVYASLSGTTYQFDVPSGKRKEILFNFSPLTNIREYVFWALSNEGNALALCEMRTDGEIAVKKRIPVNRNNIVVSENNVAEINGKGVIWYKITKEDTLKYVAEVYSIDANSALFIAEPWYIADKKASETLRFLKGDRIYSFEQLDVKYNRPDKVLEAIGSTDTALINSYRKAYEKRIKKLGIDTTSFRSGYSVPEAEFKDRDAIIYEQTQQKLALRISGNDSTFYLDRFNVWVNESPVFGMRGINLKGSRLNSIDTTIVINLSEGENRIETSITNVNGTESYRMPLMVNYAAAIKQQEKVRFVGIGIDKFSDSKHNLQYSAKDIRDIAHMLKEKYGERVIIDTLFNENVSVSNVKALKQKLLQTSVNDKVIIAYSGHGMLSKDYDYYLSTYAVNFGKPEEKGLHYDELENLLDSIPARKKLMLIDACHSGEVDKEELLKLTGAQQLLAATGVKVSGGKGVELFNLDQGKLGMKNSFELMQALFVNVGRSTGATVISAAAGTQFALEKNDLQNGVFSYSILEYMKANPHATVSALKRYVNQRVRELTAGLQVPTTRNETNAVDWEVW